MLNSLRARLTLWYVCALALILAAFGAAVYVMMSRALHRRVDEALRSTLDISVTSLTHDAQEGQSVQSAAQSTAAELSHPQQALMIFDAEGRLLAEHPYEEDLHVRLPDLGAIPAGEVYLYTAAEESDADDRHRLAVRRVRIPPADTPYIILASQPLEAVEDELESLREILYFATPAALLLAGLGGWFLARQGLAPVGAMARSAREIGAGSLDRQLPVANPRDELGQLANTFNELLARLDAAFAEQRRFMADASHELRTPLSVMSTAAGVTLKKEHRGEEEYREALRMVAEQTRRLSRIVQDMFTLARADAGRYPLRKRPLYLDDLLAEVARAGGFLASARSVTVELSNRPESAFHGDEDLLRQMLLNLVDNAVKFTPEGGVVRLGLERRGDEYLLSVSDNGPGIPAETRAHVFERFYRADKVRPRAQDGGAGLGLAIARWIAQAHDGDLQLVDSDGPGATFVARLPYTARNPRQV
ncbi:MAG TPA: heavy metal sensor histidine kinase [Pyrinomonadaceae bacterium]|nr:heavy metal sensor histidine kinase [Pyrinomonadaceae bacterium]